MPKFAKMLANGMKKRGHAVITWSPTPFFYRLPHPQKMGKWLGYIDQYLVFPFKIRRYIKKTHKETLFVFSDQALGPWIPLVAHLPHIVHCHDFLAQRSAVNEVVENKIGFTGKLYQRYIRMGFQKGKNFISVSNKTRQELFNFLIKPPLLSEVVYNGLNQSFKPGNIKTARQQIGDKIQRDLSSGYCLHVGGNQWYKNRPGVICVYDSWRAMSDQQLPLLMVGRDPSPSLQEAYNKSRFKNDIFLLSSLNDEDVKTVYQGASVFLFPSLAEGFGWPIAEAMASGCPVLTTDEAPMTEVTGNAGFLIKRMPFDKNETNNWANESAQMLNHILTLPLEERQQVIKKGIENAQRFDAEIALNKIESIYRQVLQSYYQK